MPRPSRNVDVLLLRAGRELFPETGATLLSVRRIAARAGVNLGMFHYHFGTKDAFVRRLLQDLYDEMFAKLELAAAAGTPIEALRGALNVLGRFARDNGRLLRRLFTDALGGEPLAVEFLRANVPRHVAVILGLVKAGQKAALLRPLAPPQALFFLAGSVAFPILIAGVFTDRAIAPAALGRGIAAAVATDAAIAERVECALAGLAEPQAAVVPGKKHR